MAMPKKRRPEAGTELLVRYGFSRLGCQHSRGGRAAAADRTRAMQQVKYRLVNPGLAPPRTKLEMPGWAGQPEPRTDGSQEYAWHCAPFTEGVQYGIEVFYPHDNELRVSRKNGALVFDGDFGPPPDDGGDRMWPPFRSFGQDYYTYQLLLDLKVGKDWAIRTEPHPRFYTDPTDSVPITVPALLRTEWWPMISFVVFKSPGEGHTHIFRAGEPMLQILILPLIADFNLAAMDEEAAEREMRGRRIHGSRPMLAADTTWTSRSDTVFDGTYRHLLRAAKAREREQ